jgi:hypothetical protein
MDGGPVRPISNLLPNDEKGKLGNRCTGMPYTNSVAEISIIRADANGSADWSLNHVC